MKNYLKPPPPPVPYDPIMGFGSHPGTKPFDASGDENRANHYLGSFLRLVNSYGNLFGRFRETVPAFDPIKAAEGRRRGWRD
jgi:hypothetical protein